MRTAVAALCGVVLLAGCTGLGGQTDADRFRQLQETAADSTYHPAYTLDVQGAGGIGSMIAGAVKGIDIYQRGTDRKIVASLSLLGTTSTTALFTDGGHTVTCSEEQALTGGTTLHCRPGGDTDAVSDLVRLDAVNASAVNYTGTRTVADRPCSRFLVPPRAFDTDATPGSELTGTDTAEDGLRSVSVCLDKEKGYLAEIVINASTGSGGDSEIGGSGSADELSLALRVDSHSDTVTDADLALPRAVGVASYCSTDTARIGLTPFRSGVGSVTVQAGGRNDTVAVGAAWQETNHSLSTDRVGIDGTVDVFGPDGVSTVECSTSSLDLDFGNITR